VWAFFGLSPDHRLAIHHNIFQLVTFGKGGWTYDAVYNLPVYLRNYYSKLLSDVLTKEADAVKQAQAKPPTALPKPPTTGASHGQKR
jgi:hypothetical protein